MGNLLNVACQYVKSHPARFHVPGHKGINFLKNLGENAITEYDLTEIIGMDNLFEPLNSIRDLENDISKLYKCKSVISTQGSTSCIQAMLASCINPGEKIILSRTIHSSVLNTLILLDAIPIWLYGNYSNAHPFGEPVTSDQIEKAILNNADASCIFLTGEDYYGSMPNVKSAAIVCKRHNKHLLVDNAHGAYLNFLNVNCHPINLGASFCCDSWHKTLPALTGAAVLHMDKKFNAKSVKQKMSIFSSTSPSYLTMLSMDVCLDYIRNNFEFELKNMLTKLDEIKKSICLMGFTLLNKTYNSVLKLAISGLNVGINGFELASKLRKFNVEPEYVDYNCVVLITSLFNLDSDYGNLLNTLKSLKQKKILKAHNYNLRTPLNIKCSLRKSAFANFKLVALKESLWQISGLQNLKCPPCIPIIMPGETITQEAINVLKMCGYKSINVLR